MPRSIEEQIQELFTQISLDEFFDLSQTLYYIACEFKNSEEMMDEKERLKMATNALSYFKKFCREYGALCFNFGKRDFVKNFNIER